MRAFMRRKIFHFCFCLYLCLRLCVITVKMALYNGYWIYLRLEEITVTNFTELRYTEPIYGPCTHRDQHSIHSFCLFVCVFFFFWLLLFCAILFNNIHCSLLNVAGSHLMMEQTVAFILLP